MLLRASLLPACLPARRLLTLPCHPPTRCSVLLDNALSAVDHHTAQHIFDTCIRGLFKDKACVLVTHQVRAWLGCARMAGLGV